jgi:hypothetical protein
MTKGQKQGLFAILTIVFIFLGITAISESQQMQDISFSIAMEEDTSSFGHYQNEGKTYGRYAMLSFAAALVCIFMIFASKKKKGEE